MNAARIETRRLLLRPPERADAPAIRGYLAQEHVRQYNCLGKLPTVEELERILLHEPEKQFSIVRKEDGLVLGHIGLEEDALRFRVKSVSLDYYLGEAHTRKGYMLEALDGLLRYLFLREGMEAVSALAFVENSASIALLEKLGFTREGTLRRAMRTFQDKYFDDAVFSLLREEYLAAHPPPQAGGPSRHQNGSAHWDCPPQAPGSDLPRELRLCAGPPPGPGRGGTST